MAGVVLVTEFTVPQAVGANFSGYIEYLDRESSKEKPKLMEDYLDYMDNPEKAVSLFTENKDKLSPDEKNILKDAFTLSQKNGSLMWQTVLSFDNDFLEEYGLYDSKDKRLDDKKLMEYTRVCMDKLLKSEKIADSAVWSGAIHYNTDNIHIHIATVEPIPTREKKQVKYISLSKEWLKEHNIAVPSTPSVDNAFSEKTDKNIKDLYFKCRKQLLIDNNINFSNTIYVTQQGGVNIAIKDIDTVPKGTTITEIIEPKGSFKKASISKAKSAVINLIIDSKEVNHQINNVIRKDIIETKKSLSIEKDKKLAKMFIDLHGKMPKDKRMWKYNMNAIAHLRPQIDELSMAYIRKYHKEDFKKLSDMLDKQEQNYRRAYAENATSNNIKDNKIKDLYARLGNTILNELKAYDKSLNQKPQASAKDLITQRTSTKLEFSLRKLKKLLNNDFDHYKNQQAFKELERQSQTAYEY